MSDKWYVVIIISVLTITVISGWEIYKALVGEKDVAKYEQYVAPISADFDSKLLQNVYQMQGKILVSEETIEPAE